MATKKKTELHCHACNAPLDDSNCRRVPSDFSYSGYSAYCVDCEAAFFDRLASIEGRSIALFHTCAALNIPLKPIVLDSVDFENCDEPFRTYITALSMSKKGTKRGKVLGFESGCTALQEVFGKGLSHKDFAAYIDRERTKIGKLQGTVEQRERWGTEPLYEPPGTKGSALTMTKEVYEDLDRVYDTRVSAFKGQDLTPQQLSVLVRVSKKEVIADFLMRKGLTKAAADMEKSISAMLADENMRPKDKKPVEEVRIDALVLALEEAGLMENGDLLTYDELIEVLRDRFIKAPKYEYSLDVADQTLLYIINAMRQNAEPPMPPIQELSSEFAHEDIYGEFEPEETEREKENKRYLGITKVNIVDNKKGEEE